MTTFTGTKFNDALFDSGLFDSALSDHMPGLAGNDAPTADAGDRSVELVEHESATRPHADRAMLLHGDFSSLVDTDGKAGTDTVVEVEFVGRLKADSNEVAVEGLIGRDDDISLEPTRLENVTRPHSDGVVLLTEELYGNYQFLRIEPTSSAPESVRSMGDGHGNDAKGVGFADGTSNTTVFAERYALSGAEGDDLLPGGGNGNETKIVDIVDGTSNTLAIATNSVVESVNVKYTLFSNGDDDPVAGVARLAGADYGSDGGPLRDGDLLDVGDLLFGLAGNESATADGGDGFVESAVSAGVTRPHADGVVTNNNDPDTLATVIDDIYDGTSSTFVDGIDRSGNNALASRNGGEVVSSDSYIINGTTGTVSDSGNDAKITDMTDGTSNTALDASGKDAAYIFGRTDGSAASNVIEALAEKYTMFEGEADGLLVGGAGGAGSDPPTDDARDGSIELVEHESATRPHADEVLVLHGDFSSLVDSDAAIAAATEELFGNYNFLRIEPTSSEVDSGVKSRFADEGLIADTGDSLVATALLHGDFSSLVDTDGKAGTDTVIEVDPIVLEPGQHKEELVGRLKYDSEVVDYISLEPTRFENVTRPHSDGGVLLHGDFSSLVDTDAAIAAATEELFGNYNFVRSEPTASELLVGGAGGAGSVLVSRASGEVVGSDSYVTNGTTGTVSDSGDDTRIAGIADGLSNTIMFGTTGGSAASNVVEAVATKYTMFDGDGDGLLPGGNGADRLVRVADLGVHSVLHGGDVLDVSDLSVDLGAGDRVSTDSAPYTLADDIEGDVSENVANGPAGKETLNGNINNIDLWVGDVLDVGDVLIGFDDAVDNGNDSQQTRTAGGSTALQADPDGQANGIIAVLIGLIADIPGPLDNVSPTLD
jgi:hypothetical protein